MKREFRVIGKSHFKDIVGIYMSETKSEIQLRMPPSNNVYWFNRREVEEVNYTDGWEVGTRVSAQLDGSTVYGEIILVAPTYLKIRVVEGKYRNRELVRVPVDISRATVTERTSYRLNFRHGKPESIQSGIHIVETEADAFEYLERHAVSNNMTDITLTKIITRTELPKPIKIKISFEY